LNNIQKYWKIEYDGRAKKEYLNLDGSVREQLDRVIRKVSSNPLPKSEG